MKRIIALLSLLALISNILATDQYLDDLIDQALERNPDILSMKYHIEALQEKEVTAQKLMDPMFAVEYSNVPFSSWVLDETPMSGIQFKLQQTIPFPGKNRARQNIAVSETESSSWDLEELKLQLTGQLKKMYYNLYTIRLLKTLSEDHITYLQQLRGSLQTKYETGKSNQHDLLKMDLMVQKLQDDLKDYELQDLEITATLNSILNRDISEPIKTTSKSIELKDFAEMDVLFSRAENNRPLFKRMEQDIHTKNLEMELVKKDKLPDLTFWAGYRYRQDMNGMESPDFASIGISFPLPLDFLKKTEAKHSLFSFKKQTIESKYENIQNKTEAQLKTALANYHRLIEKINNYEENLIPGSRTALEMTLTAYENGKADFSSLYQSQLQILDFERTLIKTKNKAVQHQVSIDTLIGDLREK